MSVLSRLGLKTRQYLLIMITGVHTYHRSVDIVAESSQFVREYIALSTQVWECAVWETKPQHGQEARPRPTHSNVLTSYSKPSWNNSKGRKAGAWIVLPC